MVKIESNLVPNRFAVKVISTGVNTREYITIHETGNTDKGSDANAHARLQANGNNREASWHITVDEKRAIRSFLDTSICWHAGASYPRTSGNPRSIGIEICINSDGDFSQAVRNAASVAVQLMKMHNIPISKVVQHNHWSGKDCPYNLRGGRKGINWTQFKQMVLAEYEGKKVAAVDKEGDELRFSSPALKAETELTLGSKARREIIVNAAVAEGAHESWKVKLNEGTITDADLLGLAAKYIVDVNK
ncbi:N-acetylmuramoyl-L-alanine amidase [Mammaliicoccus sciuri]